MEKKEPILVVKDLNKPLDLGKSFASLYVIL